MGRHCGTEMLKKIFAKLLDEQYGGSKPRMLVDCCIVLADIILAIMLAILLLPAVKGG